jgi:hypothetical protein
MYGEDGRFSLWIIFEVEFILIFILGESRGNYEKVEQDYVRSGSMSKFSVRPK